MTAVDYGKTPITPQDVVMMHEILMDWCQARGISATSRESEKQARQIIRWFESGCSSENLLRDIILPPAFRNQH